MKEKIDNQIESFNHKLGLNRAYWKIFYLIHHNDRNENVRENKLEYH